MIARVMHGTFEGDQTAFDLGELGAYTHLRHTDAILIRDWSPSGSDQFTFAVHWPAVEGPGPYDPRILAQTIRQTGLFVAHAAYGVPTAHQTLLRRLDFTVTPGLLDGRSTPLEVGISVSKPDVRSVSALGMEFHIRLDGMTVSRAQTEFGWVSPGAYRRLRGEAAGMGWGKWPVPEPVAPESVGRAGTVDVSLAPGGRPHRWLLRNDPANSLLFDHPVDHVPGLALLDAAEQAAHAVLGSAAFEVTSVSTAYERYVEFDQPCWIEAELLTPEPGRFVVVVKGTQSGESAFQVQLSGARP